MSQSYIVRVKRSLTQVIENSHSVHHRISMLPILDSGRMSELLCDELLQSGYIREGDSLVKEWDQYHLKLDPVTQVLSISLTEEREFSDSYDGEVSFYGDGLTEDGQKKAGEGAADGILQGRAHREKQEHKRGLMERMEKLLPDLARQIEDSLEEPLEKVHRRALEEKAHSMGEVVQVSETESGEFVIRVKVNS